MKECQAETSWLSCPVTTISKFIWFSLLIVVFSTIPIVAYSQPHFGKVEPKKKLIMIAQTDKDIEEFEREAKETARLNKVGTCGMEDLDFEVPESETKVTESSHPEKEGSLSAMDFLLEPALGIDNKLAREVWKNPRNALKKHKSAFRKAKNLRNRESEREALTQLGHIYYLLGLFEKSRESYKKALELGTETGSSEVQAQLTSNIGVIDGISGQYDKAKDRLKKALSKSKEIADTKAQTMILNNLGIIAKNQGRLQEAASYLQESSEVHRKADSESALTLSNLGNTYLKWGQPHQSLECYNRLIRLFNDKGNKRGEASVLEKMAEAYMAIGKKKKALESLENALNIYKQVKAPVYRINNLIGSLYLGTGDIKKAEPYIKKGKYNSTLGRLCLMKSDFKGAIQYYNKLQRSATKYNRARDLFTAYVGLGKAYEALGNFSKAESYYSKATEVGEEIRSFFLLTEKSRFFAKPINGFSPWEPAKGLGRVWLKRKKPDKSIYAGEVTRARVFAERIAERAEAGKLDVPARVLEKEEKLFNRLAVLRKARSVMPREKDPVRFDKISSLIVTVEREIKAFTDKVRDKYPRYGAVRCPKPVELKHAALKADEYTLVFDLLGEGVGIKLIKGKKIIFSSYQECDLDKLEKDIRDFRSCFETVKFGDFDPELGKKLYHTLLEGAMSKVPRGTPVTLVPDGVLALLPFDALVVDGRPRWQTAEWGAYPVGIDYVADYYPISYYQSITALTLSRTLSLKDKGGDDILVVADPVFQTNDERAQNTLQQEAAGKNRAFYIKLMAAIKEDNPGSFSLPRLKATGELAGELRKAFGQKTEVYTGLEAKKSIFVGENARPLSKYRYVILATHAFAGNNLPGIMEPCLALTMVPQGTDGFLKMTEVLGMELNADLVALTACQTGVGQRLPGEGVMSLG